MEVFEECGRKWLWVGMNKRKRRVQKGNLKNFLRADEEIRKNGKKFYER